MSIKPIYFFILLMVTLLHNAHAANEIEAIFKEMSEIDEPFKLRDPFQPQISFERDTDGNAEQENNGVFTNIPTLGPVRLEDIRITGVLIGNERRAFITDGNEGTVYTVKEGMKLGPNQAEVKAILPGGLILVEKIVNIYGETEYLETVIPISK